MFKMVRSPGEDRHKFEGDVYGTWAVGTSTMISTRYIAVWKSKIHTVEPSGESRLKFDVLANVRKERACEKHFVCISARCRHLYKTRECERRCGNTNAYITNKYSKFRYLPFVCGLLKTTLPLSARNTKLQITFLLLKTVRTTIG